MNKIKDYFGPILIVVICILSFVFPFSIHFEDALSLETVPEFGIDISIWKIIFEPILGLLLFFNRSLYALQELPFMLLWTIVIFLIISWNRYRSIIKQERVRFLKGQLAKIPILIGLWFAIFVVIIFIPLPNNKIVNHTENYILVSTHAHTEYSHDGLISQKNMWKWQKNNRFDAFFITDHANHSKTFEFVTQQRKGNFESEPLMMVGEEYSASNHMSLLGLKNKFTTKGLSDQQVVDSVHAYGGVVLMNHWFDGKGKALNHYRNLGVDGFEIENSGKENYYDRNVYHQLKDYCKENNLMMHGGLDYHGYGNACFLWNAFDIPNWHQMDADSKEKAILDVLKNGDQSKLKILMYKDRPYYENKNLMFRPFLTLINYFRTLNIYQVLSWIIWIGIVFNFKKRINKEQITSDKTISVFGILGAIFLLLLGLSYYMKNKKISGFTEMYEEYSVLLFYSGAVFLLYMLGFIYFRLIKQTIRK